MRIRQSLYLIILLTFVACGSQLEQDVEALVKAKNTWIEKTDSKPYSFTLKHVRHHSKYNNIPINIRVENQKIVSAKILSSGESIQMSSDMPTIKSIFMGIFEFIKSCEQTKACDSTYLEVEYHEIYGYPKHVKQKYSTGITPSTELFVSDVSIEE